MWDNAGNKTKDSDERPNWFVKAVWPVGYIPQNVIPLTKCRALQICDEPKAGDEYSWIKISFRKQKRLPIHITRKRKSKNWRHDQPDMNAPPEPEGTKPLVIGISFCIYRFKPMSIHISCTKWRADKMKNKRTCSKRKKSPCWVPGQGCNGAARKTHDCGAAGTSGT